MPYLGFLTLIINPNTTKITNTAITSGITILISEVSKSLFPTQFKYLNISLINPYTIIETTDAIIIGFNIYFLLTLL
jgi:hypothetical protein